MATTIDTSELARTGGSLSGDLPLSRLDRLGSLLADTQGAIAWRVRGWRIDRAGTNEDFMALSFDVVLRPTCVRCLQPVDVELHVARTYRLVETEDEAQRIDLDEDDHDVIAAGERFDLAALIEDEAIMDLPPAPRHESCDAARSGAEPSRPGAGTDPSQPGDPADPRPAQSDDPCAASDHPFAALRSLRGKRPPDGD